MARITVAVLVVAALGGLLVSAAAGETPPPSCHGLVAKRVVLEAPEVLVYSTPATRKQGIRSTRFLACDRASRRTSTAWIDYSSAHEAGSGAAVELAGGRFLLVEESGGGAESEETTRALLDVKTGKRTRDVLVGGTTFGEGEAVTGGGLLLSTGGGDSRVVLRRPGSKTATVLARGQGFRDLAITDTTAYWRAGDVVRSAALPAPAAARTRAPVPSPAGTRGRCEVAGSTTRLRTARLRIFGVEGGGVIACSRTTGRKTTLAEALPGVVATAPPAHGPDLRVIAPNVVGYRLVAGAATALVVLDVDSGKVLHQAVVAGSPQAVAFEVAGIAFVDGAALRLVRGSAVADIDAGAVANPAIHPAGDDDGKTVVYWTSAGQARSLELVAP